MTKKNKGKQLAASNGRLFFVNFASFLAGKCGTI